MDSSCAQCKLQVPVLKKCSGCKKVSYCSVDCQKKHWSNHKYECGIPEKEEKQTKNDNLQCDNCKKHGLNLKKCLGCNSAHYCSKTCQTDAWPEHKIFCLDTKMKQKFLSSPLSIFYNLYKQCACCGKTVSDPGLKRNCPQCLKAVYCSRYCLTSDWLNHRQICDNSPTPFSDGNKETTDESQTSKTCNVCDKNTNLKSCGNCKKVFYCSRVCQKSDWKMHKNNCSGHSNSNYSETVMKKKIETEEKLREMRIRDIKLDMERQRSKKYKYQTFGTFDNEALNYDDNADITIVKRPRLDSWNHATEASRVQYNEFCILSSFKKVPRESQLVTKSYLLVSFIPRHHHYRGRHCVFVEDVNGHEMYIAFYFKSQQFPSFEWSEIRPGRFIFVQHPRIHNFGDSSVGFRLEDPKNFKLADY